MRLPRTALLSGGVQRAAASGTSTSTSLSVPFSTTVTLSFGTLRLLPHSLRGGQRGLEDPWIRAAAARVARAGPFHLLERRVRVLLEQRRHGNDEPRSAEP